MSILSGMETLIITAVILLLTASWRLYQKRKYYRGVTSKLPTVYGIPFIGIIYKMLDVNKIFHNFHIKHVLTSSEFFNKAEEVYKHFQNGVFNGLIVAPAKKWKADRKIISTFVAHNNNVAWFPVFNSISLKNKLERLVGQGEQDIYTIIK